VALATAAAAAEVVVQPLVEHPEVEIMEATVVMVITTVTLPPIMVLVEGVAPTSRKAALPVAAATAVPPPVTVRLQIRALEVEVAV
jgi:hypothetical protein